MRLKPTTRFRVLDLPVLVASAARVLQAPLSVVEANWVPYLEPVPRLALLGLITGYLVERARLPGPLGLPLGVLLGFEALTAAFAPGAGAGPLAHQVDVLGSRIGSW